MTYSRGVSVGSLHTDADPGAAGVAPRVLATALTLIIGLPLALEAMWALESSALSYGGRVEWQARALTFVPLFMLASTAARRQFRIARGLYWAWNFVFLGVAPSFQLARQSFPWGGEFPISVIEDAQTLIISGHVAFLVAAGYINRRSPRRYAAEPLFQGETISRDRAGRMGSRQEQILGRLALGYCVAAALFITLMGSALFNARAIFRTRVLEIAELPLGGFLYFAVTAGAIVVPGAAIAARRHGAHVPTWLIATTWIVAGVVTNPLVGSRFLTGSFLVATAVALLPKSALLRFVPVSSVLLLVAVFPTLDLLRGDNTGSQEVAVLAVDESMLDYDFDAFEMGAREVSITPTTRAHLPSSQHMLMAPFARWVPLLARPYIGDSGGSVVAEATGMQYTNVSMPLWAEGDLVAGYAGAVIALAALGAWVALIDRGARSQKTLPQIASLPGSAALLFIVLRGSLYEVLGYFALAAAVYIWLARAEPKTERVNHG